MVAFFRRIGSSDALQGHMLELFSVVFEQIAQRGSPTD